MKPKYAARSAAGAQAPNDRIPTTAPDGPTQRYQPNVAACSTATRAATDGGRTASRYACGCAAKSSQLGRLREAEGAFPWAADAQDWWRVVEVNLCGPFLLAEEVVPQMVSRGSGRVLHVNSSTAGKPQPLWSAYGVSKAGLSRLTDSMAVALRDTGVVVRFARGDLDALHGRFVAASKDDVDDLLAAIVDIEKHDARTLRFRAYGDADPLA